MQIIPLIKIKNRNILNFQIKDILTPGKYIKQDSSLYVLDYDGIEKNKPNLCTYQKLSKYYNIWTDFAPKNIGDIVDSFMSGVSSIIIRSKHYPDFNPIKIKEISDNKILLKIGDQTGAIKTSLSSNSIDGYINFKNRNEIESNIRYKSLIKQFKQRVYTHESNYENMNYWKKREIKGLIVDIDKIKRFK